MKRNAFLLFFAASFIIPSAFAAQSILYERALESYKDKEYPRALDQFMDVLLAEPENKEAQEYVRKIGREILSGRADVSNLDVEPAVKDLKSHGLSKGESAEKQAKDSLSTAQRAARKDQWIRAWDDLRRFRAMTVSDPKQLRVAEALEKKIDAGLQRLFKEQEGAEGGFLKRGFDSYKKGNYDAAVENWRAYVLLESEQDEISVMIKRAMTAAADRTRQNRWQNMVTEGERSFRTGRYAEARQYWEEALAITPNDDSLKRKLSTLGGVEQASSQVQSGRYNEALGTLTDVLTLEPRNEMALSLLQLLEKQVGRNPNFMMKLGEHPALPPIEKVKDQSSVASLPPGPPSPAIETPMPAAAVGDRVKAMAHYNRGLVFYSENKLDQAIAEWKTSTQYDPSFQKSQKAMERAVAEQQSH